MTKQAQKFQLDQKQQGGQDQKSGQQSQAPNAEPKQPNVKKSDEK